MKTYRKEDLDNYLQNDWIKRLIDSSDGIERNRYDSWLYDIDAKRMIYADVYGDILKGEGINGEKVIDIGGGYTLLTSILANNCDYTLVDFLAHCDRKVVNQNTKVNWISKDWYEIEYDDEYDIVIANDLFPDVDQRMELFIERFLPISKEIRLILTYYNSPKFYITKRIDDPEIMTFLSWDGEITSLKLKHFSERLLDTEDEEILKMQNERESIYRNGRQVSYVRIKGDL